MRFGKLINEVFARCSCRHETCRPTHGLFEQEIITFIYWIVRSLFWLLTKWEQRGALAD